jgi:hypothetical protein
MSALAAHTFDNLKDPHPDLVRGLILNQTDLLEYEPQRGWGTPHPIHMPWNCRPGTVTLAWRAGVRPGLNHYWEDIPIPRELVRNGKLHGQVWLTTIHRPLVNEDGGPSYIATRIGAAIQYLNRREKIATLVGVPEIEVTPELEAREEGHKWQPVRRNYRDFTKRGGLSFSGSSLRLYARLFTRNLFQFGYTSNADVGEIDTVFVVTFSDGSQNSTLYNGMTVSLGNFVESAVINQDIHIDR